MIQNVAYTSAAALAARRGKPAEADHTRTAGPQPAAERDAAVVDIDRGTSPVAAGGFGLDLAYSRQVTRIGRGQTPQVVSQTTRGVSLEFRFATQALPRGDDGEVDLDALANTEEKNALSGAIAKVAEHGLRDPGALASFVEAVDTLFGEYEKDLGLSKGELDQAKQKFTDEVKSFFAQVEEEGEVKEAGASPVPFASINDALAGLRQRLMSRREDVLAAAGDLSKVLAELTAEADEAPKGSDAERRAAGKLGGFLKSLSDAVAHRSTRDVREPARQRLLTTDGEIADRIRRPDPSEEAVTLGRAFLQHLHAA